MKVLETEPIFYFAAGDDFAVFVGGFRDEKTLVPVFMSMWIIVNNNPVTGTDPFGLLNWCYWKCSLWCNAVGTIVICPPFTAAGFTAGGPAGLIGVGGGCFIVTKAVCHKICSDRCPPPETPEFCGPPEPTPPGPGAPNPGGPRYP